MFRVSFRDSVNSRDLLRQQILLHDLPQKGERVEIRKDLLDYKPRTGVVVDRHWVIIQDDTNTSEVIISVALDNR